MKRPIFLYLDYKEYLRELLRSDDAKWGAISQMADAAGCQRSYLSRCLNAEVHLTLDHAFNIAQYLEMSDLEEEYFLNLVELSRASTNPYRNRITKKLKKLKIQFQDLESTLKRPKSNLGEGEVFYYSGWLATAIHIIVSIPEYQTSRAIAERLNVDAATIEMQLLQLEQMGLVRKDHKKWVFGSGELHLPKNSPLVHMHHANWRHRALLDSQKNSNESIHFTAVQSMDQKAFEQVKARMLKALAESFDIASPSPSEELVCLSCDFFKV